MALKSPPQSGFTLIEVMVALAIFALAAVAALQAASGHISGLSSLQDKTYAQYVASNRLAELALQRSWPISDNKTGEAMMGDQRWRWQQQVTETVTPNVVAVTVSVGRAGDEGEAIQLVSYLRKPVSKTESSVAPQ
ncbi:type II secretion system minor pseudopilin GspI [Idiomarina seosinensis]|uniref:Type II secretion system protein I n=1 Tax=Idiomarina seosinensis TaxID=281739 RepID=A0A432ZCV0_9GAMM|nr:type II secretion system minor pseudopilin GspI [Idiomarina seosinensis]RUO75785.1 type II secretion system protein GspI [Idiomarina seosinensis]